MGTFWHLITDGASHYCEKARWALDRAGVIYRESKHVVILHMFFTRGLGTSTSCPKLVMGSGSEQVVFQESPDIMHFADRNISREEDRLYPADEESNRLVHAWEQNLDKKLGPHVRRWAYCYLLFDSCSYRLLTQGAPLWERIVAWFLMPIFRRILYRALQCNSPGAKEKSLEVIKEIFCEDQKWPRCSFDSVQSLYKQKVDDHLQDGRPYLCGSRFTGADLTLAALAGPMINPSESGAWMPTLECVPREMASIQQMLRNTIAGKHVLKCYQVHRSVVVK